MPRYHKLSITFLQKHHSENKGLDKVMETQAQVDELKGIMVRNIGTFHGIVRVNMGKNVDRLPGVKLF